MSQLANRQRCKPIGDALGGSGMGLGAGCLRHGVETSRIVEKAYERGEQFAGLAWQAVVELAFVEHDGGACVDHGFSIAALVLIGSRGKRDKERGLSGGGELGDGGSSAAGEDQAGGGKARGHVVKERADFPARGVGAAGSIGSLSSFNIARAALVENGELRDSLKEGGSNGRHLEVEDAGSL